MAEDVKVVVIGADFEALVVRSVPLIEDFFHFVGSLGVRGDGEAKGSLIGLVAGVALDFKTQTHGDEVIESWGHRAIEPSGH